MWCTLADQPATSCSSVYPGLMNRVAIHTITFARPLSAGGGDVPAYA